MDCFVTLFFFPDAVGEPGGLHIAHTLPLSHSTSLAHPLVSNSLPDDISCSQFLCFL